MQNSFFQAVCRVGIFMICAQAIVHFRPQEAYEKYLKLLVGIMVMIQLFWPIGGLLLGEGRQEAADMLGQFRQGLEQGMAEADQRAGEAEAVLEQMTLEELRRHLAGQGDGAGEARQQDTSEEGAGEIRQQGTSEEGVGEIRQQGTGGEGAGEIRQQCTGGEGAGETRQQGTGGKDGQGEEGAGEASAGEAGAGTDGDGVKVDVAPVEPIRIPSSDKIP